MLRFLKAAFLTVALFMGAFSLPVSAANPSLPAPPASASWYCTYEGTTSCTNVTTNFQCASSPPAHVINNTSISRDGTGSLQLQVYNTDTNVAGSGTWVRCDESFPAENTEGTEDWYFGSFYFPTGSNPTAWVYAPGNQCTDLLLEFHSAYSGDTQPNEEFQVCGTPNSSPSSLPFNTSNSAAGTLNQPANTQTGLFLRLYGGTGSPGTDGPGRRNFYLVDPNNLNTGAAGKGMFAPGVWYDFMFHFKWSTGSGGLSEMWINGTKVLSASGANLYQGTSQPGTCNGTNNACPTYLKNPNYHAPWDNVSTDGQSIIYDHIVKGSTAAAVVPCSGGTVSSTGVCTCPVNQIPDNWGLYGTCISNGQGGGDTTPPTVSMTAPTTGTTIGGTVTLSANAMDNVAVASVQFKVDNANVGSPVTVAPYNLSWDSTTATNRASHNITATATDTSGNSATSTAVTVTTCNSPYILSGGVCSNPPPPSISVTSPLAGATVSGTTNVTASASSTISIAGVQFTLDGNNLGTQDTTAPYSISWNTATAANGTHTLGAVATDSLGQSTTSSSVSVTVNNAPPPDTTPPTVSITAPAAGSTLTGNVTFSANASDNVAVASVDLKVDGVLLSHITNAPYSATWVTTNVANGTHTLSAVATDSSNNTSTVSETVTVNNAAPGDTTPPTVSITAPTAGSTISGVATLSANATDNVAVQSVQFKLNGVNLGAAVTSAPYNFSWDTTGSTNGTYTLSAVATDTSNNSTTSASVSVTVSNASPPPPVLPPPTPGPTGPAVGSIGSIAQFPGYFEAENYPATGEGVAFHSYFPGNPTSFYRKDGIGILPSCDVLGGTAVLTHMLQGDWVSYPINVTADGNYLLQLRVSNNGPGQQGAVIQVEVDGVDVIGTTTIPWTKSWCNFQWVNTHGFFLTQGPHMLKIVVDSPYFDLNSFKAVQF